MRQQRWKQAAGQLGARRGGEQVAFARPTRNLRLAFVVKARMEFWIGTSGFQYPEWKGTFYPEEMPAAQMLAYYAERLATTEINYSFRRIPSEKTIAKWAAETPARFRFTFKAPQKVTHFARLQNVGDTMRYFHAVIGALGEKLGVVLCQLPPHFEKDTARLESFLAELPKPLRVAFEFRDPTWLAEDVYAVLRAHNAALCLAESEDFATPQVATADFGYLRLRRTDYDGAALARWAKFVRAQHAQWRETFIYFKHEEAGVGPKFARQMSELLAK